MSKPVDKIEFWKERIDTALKPHYSVYVVHEAKWNIINESHCRLLDRFIPKSANVLDAGCGYGRWAEHFDKYTGVDFSPDFIKLAREKYPQKKFIQADLKDLPFFDKQFDWAFCVSIKQMISANLGGDEWRAMGKELKRVAKNVLILEYEDPTKYEVL